MLNPGLVARFWENVERKATDECWPWKKSINGVGYGQLWDGESRRVLLTHRISYIIHHGDPGELFVCHTCDNRRCCNPNHLFSGTQGDNLRDMVRKGRNYQSADPSRLARGARNGSAKLDECSVMEIRQLRKDGLTLREIAERFGVTESAIHLICVRKKWKHV